MDYQNFFTSALATLQNERRYRVFADIERLAGRFPRQSGMAPPANGPSPSGAPTIILAWVRTGMSPAPWWKPPGGSAPVRAVPATSPATATAIVDLESELADLHGKDAALVFTSGYVSNQTGIATIARLIPGCLILSDALNHNSMIEGVRQSGCDKVDLPPQRSRAPRRAAECCRRPAQIDRVRKRLFDGRRHLADPRHLRPRRAIRRNDLSRRGPRGRHVRPSRRRHRRARRA